MLGSLKPILGILAAAASFGPMAENMRLLDHRSTYAPARGKTGALKIRRTARKANNVARHKRNCRG